MAEFKKAALRGLRPVQRDRLSWHQFAAEPSRYESMPYRRCGAWGLKLPAISLGSWETFGGYRGPEVTRECIFRAFNLGITHFDFANVYGRTPGRAETVVGRILREMPREELIISTKAGFGMWPGPYGEGTSRKHLIASLDQSLQRLGLDHVDIFYSHRYDPETPLDETIATLDHLIHQGKVLYAGLSNYPPNEFSSACKLAERKGWAPIVAHQSDYSLFEREIEKNFLPAAREAGVGVVAYSPLAQGLLTNKYLGEIPADSRAAKAWSEKQRAEKITDARIVQAKKLNEIAQQRGQTLAQMALVWTLRNPVVSSALIGASSVEQIEENVKALEHPDFSEDELRRIDEVTAS
ncbi:MAG TPA: aldo/keto reductase [Chthoniobacterales bacterium]|nr:aldo/keto reductase [Chthoniobacterales bacterium]